jgi:hypothetical protein
VEKLEKMENRLETQLRSVQRAMGHKPNSGS